MWALGMDICVYVYVWSVTSLRFVITGMCLSWALGDTVFIGSRQGDDRACGIIFSDLVSLFVCCTHLYNDC